MTADKKQLNPMLKLALDIGPLVLFFAANAKFGIYAATGAFMVAVLISGDTRYNQNVIKYGIGVDLLIHETAIARPELMSNLFAQAIIAHHTSPHDVGRVFAQTKPKLAAYTHMSFLSNEKVPEPTLDDLVAQTRETYDGPLEVGEDLTSFEIGDTVTVTRWKP